MAPRQEDLAGSAMVPEGSLYLTVQLCPVKGSSTVQDPESPDLNEQPLSKPEFKASPNLVLFRLFLMLYSSAKWISILETTGQSRQEMMEYDERLDWKNDEKLYLMENEDM